MYRSRLPRFDDVGTVIAGENEAPADPSQKYIDVYVPTENGQGMMQQQTNPNYDLQKYEPEAYNAYLKYAESQLGKRGGGLGSIISSSPLAKITDAISKPVGQAADYFRDKVAPLSPYLAAAAITGGTAAEFLPGLMAAEAGGAGTGSMIGSGGIGDFVGLTDLTMTPEQVAAANELATGAAGNGAAGALQTAAASSPATSVIAKLAASLGVNKAAEMLGMDPSTLVKLAGGVIAGGAAALANRGSGNSAPLARVGLQTPGDPNKLEYIGNNQYAVKPVIKAAAGGGIRGLGMRGMAPIQYKAGGKYLNGPGDGMSDNIKANIDGRQEARLADGEFVIPADVVSHIGNGSSNAGAKKLHAMMDRIRHARTGNPKQGKQIKAEKFLPA
jgi:hypothetical protein